MKLKDYPQKLRPYIFLCPEIDLEDINSDQAIGNCPFPDCSKDGHFYVSPETGQWDCKRCGRSGNIYTFIQKIHDSWFDSTTSQDYESLGEDRKIDPILLYNEKLALSPNGWVLPVFNREDKIVNLLRYGDHLYSAPTLKQELYGVQTVEDKIKIIWIVEGHWDRIVWDSVCNVNDSPEDVVAVPGANSFKDDWCKYLEGKDVRILADKDRAGQQCVNKIRDSLQKTGTNVKRLSALQWPDHLPEGYDIRDLVAESAYPDFNSDDLQDVYDSVVENLQEVDLGIDSDPAPLVQPIKCETFDDLLNTFQESGFEITDDNRSTLATLCAVNISTEMPMEPLWLYVVGPASSGKSTLCKAIAANQDYSFWLSDASKFHSGWKDKSKEGASLFRFFKDKTLVLKDFTQVLEKPADQRRQFFNHLRESFDGESRYEYGNKVESYFEGKFSIIAGVTDEIKDPKHSQATLGERFLQIDILGDERQELGRGARRFHKSFNNPSDTINLDTLIPGKTAGFLNHKQQQWRDDWNSGNTPSIPEDIEEKIVSLAAVIAFMRSGVARDHQTKDVLYEPRRECTDRLEIQLLKLTQCLCWILDKKSADQEVFQIARKVACDTISGVNLRLQITKIIASNQSSESIDSERGKKSTISNQNSGLTATQISRIMDGKVSKAAVQRYLDDMRYLGITYYTKQRSDGRGRRAHLWKLTRRFLALWKLAELGV